ncbi:MAG TPA: 30S ribosomal protein S12 methylthiotransferase RimO [Nitrospira sp.]|nr:30S ribosomal protein S12 methylthiotransferase RimO [Nitrospira sp.]
MASLIQIAGPSTKIPVSPRPKTTRATRKPTVGFVNLGCSKNQVDSEIMLGALASEGFELTGRADRAEIVIINTCGFIDEAKQESINTILEHAELKKTAACRILIAAGCLAQRYQGELLDELPELDAVVGTGDFGKIAEICRNLLSPGKRQRRLWISKPPYLYDDMAPRLRLGRHHSAYVKIAEGCNRNCAFCAIPLMRGKQRSRPVESIVAEARRLAGEGVKELNLISQDTINYGVDLGLRHGLVSLLRELVQIKELLWIRPFYLYPQQITDELLDLYAGEERIAKYIDMPLQHINDGMLSRMHRLGNRATIERLVDRIRAKILGVTFRTAFIVGFPGETDAAFEELRAFVEQASFERVAVFLYSDEEGTPAVRFGEKVEPSVMVGRRNELLAVQDAIGDQKSREKIGSILDVLIDGPSEEREGVIEGRHQGLAPEIDGVISVNAGPNPRTVHPGAVLAVKITDAAGYDLVGEIAGEQGAVPSRAFVETTRRKRRQQ